MKRQLILLFFLLFTANFTFAQGMYELQNSLDFFKVNKLNSGDWNNMLTANDIEGSPYLNEEFVPGIIYTTSKQKYVDVPLRYNIYSDQLEFKTPENKVMAMAIPELIETVEFGNIKMVYIPYTNSKKVLHGFLKVLAEGEASLYSKSNVVFKDAEKSRGYDEPEPARFIKQADSYYIRIGTGPAKRVGNKKELTAIFTTHKTEITSFIKKNKVKTNKPERLKKLVLYYNSLD